MISSEKDTRKQIDLVLNLIKIASLSFPAIAFFQYYSKRYDSVLFIQHDMLLIYVMLTILVIYIVWNNVLRKIKIPAHIRSWIDSIVAIVIAFLSVLLTGTYQSTYKFLFFFVILYSSIECSMQASMLVAGASGATVLAMDLICVPDNGINSYFESDIILACVFMIVAWTISFYVDLRKKHIENLKDLANVDELTGLYNHRYFYESLSEFWGKSQKDNLPLSMLFLDIDNFKYYNDFLGHQKGDEALTIISKILTDNLRDIENVVISRYGGEEFTVLLPDIDKEEAVKIAEKIRSAVEVHQFDGQENLPGSNMTISIGVSSYPVNAKSEFELVKFADEACYRAKFFRKNRVEQYYSILDDLQNNIEENDKEAIASVKALIAVINAKDKYTFRHVERVVYFSKIVAEILKLDDDEKKNFIFAAYMHDIGKINISEEILMKTEKLTQEEWEILKGHPTSAAAIVENINSLKDTNPIILHHHERFDGTGYPDGLKGAEISFLTRVLTVIDSFDAMTSLRPYQRQKSYYEAIEELNRCSGTQFDPEAVKVFLSALERVDYNIKD